MRARHWLPASALHGCSCSTGSTAPTPHRLPHARPPSHTCPLQRTCPLTPPARPRVPTPSRPRAPAIAMLISPVETLPDLRGPHALVSRPSRAPHLGSPCSASALHLLHQELSPYPTAPAACTSPIAHVPPAAHMSPHSARSLIAPAPRRPRSRHRTPRLAPRARLRPVPCAGRHPAHSAHLGPAYLPPGRPPRTRVSRPAMRVSPHAAPGSPAAHPPEGLLHLCQPRTACPHPLARTRQERKDSDCGTVIRRERMVSDIGEASPPPGGIHHNSTAGVLLYQGYCLPACLPACLGPSAGPQPQPDLRPSALARRSPGSHRSLGLGPPRSARPDSDHTCLAHPRESCFSPPLSPSSRPPSSAHRQAPCLQVGQPQ
jgi:hypothetical protein